MNSLIIFIQYRISMVYLLLFLGFFLPRRHSRRLMAASLAACFLLTGAADYVNIFICGSQVMKLEFTLIEILAVQGTALWISEYRDFRTLFVGISSAVYVVFGNVCSSILYVYGGHIWAALAVQILVHSVALGVLVWKIRGDVLEIFREENIGWGKMCLIPALFYAVVYSLYSWPQNIFTTPGNFLPIILALCLMETCYVLVFKLFGRYRRQNELARNLEELERYAKCLEQDSEQIQKKDMDVAVMRHDLRHYVTMIHTYLEAGDTEEIRKLLCQVEKNLDDITPEKYCESLSLNGIIVFWAHMAEKKKIDFSSEIDIPGPIRIQEFEFAAVISNLLENAVSAAEKEKDRERYVRIRLKRIKDQIILEISNTFTGRLRVSKQSGLPMTVNGKGHGYGFRSVMAFAQKNGAIFDYAAEKGRFYVRMLVTDQ